jgi:ABC-type Fe3+-citrate transport system substrate-binding protein
MNRKMRVLIAILMVAAAPFSASAQENQVTVTHELGEVLVARNPQTVVVFDYGLLDIVDSLGVEVVGVVKATLPEYLSKFKDDAYVDVGTLFEPNFERIYELQPDVILVSARMRPNRMTRVVRGCGPAICTRVASGMSGWKAEPRERKSRVHEAKLKLAGTRAHLEQGYSGCLDR